MKLIGRVVAVMFAGALLVAMGLGAWLAYKGVLALFASLDP